MSVLKVNDLETGFKYVNSLITDFKTLRLMIRGKLREHLPKFWIMSISYILFVKEMEELNVNFEIGFRKRVSLNLNPP